MAEDTGGRPSVLRLAGAAALAAGFVVVLSVALSDPVGAQGAGSGGAQDPAPTTEYVPPTTSTLPTGGELGRIVPRPNSGKAPETPGDPGGSEQVGLFWGLLAVVSGITVFVWWRSRTARRRRDDLGRDPVTVARRGGGDVRKPRPPGIVD